MSWRDLVQWRSYKPGLGTASENLQRSEKIKALSSFANNAGLALLVAGVARWFDPVKAWDGPALAALCVGAFSVMLSVAICGLLNEVVRP